MNIDKLSAEIYSQNKEAGWWDDPDRCVFQCLQLVSTELAEATEGERKGLMDDHLLHRKMGEVELADALIRLLDLAGRYDWVFSEYAHVHELITPDRERAALHFGCNMTLSDLGLAFICMMNDDRINLRYSIAVRSIIMTADFCGYDIEGAMLEKLEYNKQRADHKRENRAKDGGKKF